MATTIDLNLIATFVRVIETGSFTAAAAALGLPKSSVSRRVTALEEALGVRLLQRSTRKLVLTEAGRAYFERARAGLRGLGEASDAVAEMSHELAGLIRFTAAPDGTGLIAGMLAEFLRRHPRIRLDVLLTGRRVDLVAEGVDLALRAGRLTDSSLVARRLGSSDFGLYASRAYLRRAGTPKRLADLEKHTFILFRAAGEAETLRLVGPRGEETVKVRGRLSVDEMSFAGDAIAAGAGIGLIPAMIFAPFPRRHVRRREVVRVLPEYGQTGGELHLVSPPTGYEPARVGALRDFIAAEFHPLLKSCAAAHGRADAGREKPRQKPA
jgi:DNA-binding transcriptional LysR family regulator